jgi:hypothetical protein
MVLSYDYAKQKRRQRQTNAPPSQAISHFDGHAEALKPYIWHCPMQHVHGYTRSHWTLPSGNYSLHITPAAARVTANKTTVQNVSAGRFDVCGGAR